jgi:hypothetical protein
MIFLNYLTPDLFRLLFYHGNGRPSRKDMESGWIAANLKYGDLVADASDFISIGFALCNILVGQACSQTGTWWAIRTDRPKPCH